MGATSSDIINIYIYIYIYIYMTWAVEAVGMGATSSELRRPAPPATAARRPAQSHRPDVAAPHMSGCSTPRLHTTPA